MFVTIGIINKTYSNENIPSPFHIRDIVVTNNEFIVIYSSITQAFILYLVIRLEKYLQLPMWISWLRSETYEQ